MSEHAGFLDDLLLSSGDVNPGVFNGSWCGNGEVIETTSPRNNKTIGRVQTGTADDYESCIASMDGVKQMWANTPAPQRGEVVRVLGNLLRERKDALGHLVTLENGKILQEGLGEVQEAIDICDFAVGLARTLNGSVIPSERPGHMILEKYLPLKGHVGIITAFNFPVAVAFWNLALSLVCGNTHIWKGAPAVPLVTIACGKIIQRAFEQCGFPPSVVTVMAGSGADIGSKFGDDPRLELISFTGSTPVGRIVNAQVARRFGKSIMELGGNNGVVVMDDADLDMALTAVLFGAVGTAGQRCTTTRRLFLHDAIYDQFMEKLLPKYSTVKIGDPFDPSTLCGPLISPQSVQNFEKGIQAIREFEEATILCGGNVLSDMPGNYVEPTVVATPHHAPFVQTELFAPVLYVIRFNTFEEAVEMHNSTAYGLSSAIFTTDVRKAFEWIGPTGSDCGIVNVNIGTSGAEIGGAFGGEKDTGGGRESGSDAWKQYCRRATCTINFSKEMPLAQGIQFGD